MKTFLLSGTILIFVLILIVIFQNIAGGNSISVLFFDYSQNEGYLTPLVIMAFLGFLGGALSTMLIAQLISASKDEEAPGGNNW